MASKKNQNEPPLPPNKLDDTTVKKATAALMKYLQSSKDSKSGKKELFTKPEVITLQFTLQKLPQPKHKPYLIPLKHSLLNPEDGVELCLLTKDPADPIKDKLESKPVPGFVEVIGYTKLRKEYKQYQRRRELLNQYDGFFADERIYPMLPRLLGKVFYGRKKQPFPVKLDTPHIGQQLAKARDSTAIFPGFGTCLAVRIGLSSFTPKQLYENIVAAIQKIVQKIPQQWNNIQSIYLKSASSAALPLFAQTPSSLLALTSQGTNGNDAEDNEEKKHDDAPEGGLNSSDEDGSPVDDSDDEEEGKSKGSKIPIIGSKASPKQTTSSSKRTPAAKRKTTDPPASKQSSAKKASKSSGEPVEIHEDEAPTTKIPSKKARTPASKSKKPEATATTAETKTPENETSSATTKTPKKTTIGKATKTPKTEGKQSTRTPNTSAKAAAKTPKTASKAKASKQSPRRTRSSTTTK